MKKYRPSVAILLFLAALAAGCGKSSTDNGATAAPPSSTETQASGTASGTETQSSATAPQPTGSNATANSTANTPANSAPATQPAMTASQPSTTGDATVSQQLTQVKQDVRQTAQDLKVYTYEQRDEFVQTMQAEVDKLHQDVLQLTAKIDVAGDSIKAAAQPKLSALKTQVDSLDIYLNEAKNATAATWDEVKADSQNAYDQAKQAVQDASHWLDQQVNH